MRVAFVAQNVVVINMTWGGFKKEHTMTRGVIALMLAFVATGQAFAAGGGVPEYSALMATGKCWGLCAYRSSVADCISCGLSYHGEYWRPQVESYCRRLQPKCHGQPPSNCYSLSCLK
jgi:hypothetical protein